MNNCLGTSVKACEVFCENFSGDFLYTAMETFFKQTTVKTSFKTYVRTTISSSGDIFVEITVRAAKYHDRLATLKKRLFLLSLDEAIFHVLTDGRSSNLSEDFFFSDKNYWCDRQNSS